MPAASAETQADLAGVPFRGSFGSAQPRAALDQCLRRALSQYGEVRTVAGPSISLVFGETDKPFAITLTDQGDTRLVEVMARHKLGRRLTAQIHSCLY